MVTQGAETLGPMQTTPQPAVAAAMAAEFAARAAAYARHAGRPEQIGAATRRGIEAAADDEDNDGNDNNDNDNNNNSNDDDNHNNLKSRQLMRRHLRSRKRFDLVGRI